MNMLNSVILRPRVDSLIWLGHTGRSDTIKKKSGFIVFLRFANKMTEPMHCKSPLI